METQLYIRVRGKVLGPYDQEKLQSLARRGQLSRMHELSQDATNWVHASTYPELFVVEDRPLVTVVQQVPGETRDAVQRPGQPSVSSGRRWWYRKNNSEAGPVDETTLQQMLASGNLGPDDLVWTEGMPQWAPARQAPGLLPAQTVAVASARDRRVPWLARRKEKMSCRKVSAKSAVNSRSWVHVHRHCGVRLRRAGRCVRHLLLIRGANYHLPPVVAWGLFELIFAVDAAAGGFLLNNYSGRLASLKSQQPPHGLREGAGCVAHFLDLREHQPDRHLGIHSSRGRFGSRRYW